MQNQIFKDIMQLEIGITNKLLKYIHSKIDVIDILDEYNLDLTYIQDERNSLSLNIWLAVDYVGKDGKSFIEKFLRDESTSLSDLEKEILTEKSKSYVSLFEIMGFDGGRVHLKDILNDEEYWVLEPNINKVIETGEFLFTRVGRVLDRTIFMGDINYVPSIVKDLFLEELLIDYNNLRKFEKNLTMLDYLKKYSLNLYKIYNESLMNFMDNDDIHSYVFDELDEFEFYLLNKHNGMAVKKHLTNLSNIFEYALADNNMTLSDIDRLSLRDFFFDAIKDGLISTQEEVNTYISSLKLYLQYLSLLDSKYRQSYSELLDISKDRFLYMYKLDIGNNFNIDKDLASLVNLSLNDTAMDLLEDFDKFILYILDGKVELTSARKLLKRKDLQNLNHLLDNGILVKKKAPSQRDYPLINFFFHSSLCLGAVKIDKGRLEVTNKGKGLLRLEEGKKYSLLLNYLWSRDFIDEIIVNSDPYIVGILRDRFTEMLSGLKLDKEYKLNKLMPNLDNPFYDYWSYLMDFGLLEYSQTTTESISLTSLGKRVFHYLSQTTNKTLPSNIIKLEDFKREKYKVEG